MSKPSAPQPPPSAPSLDRHYIRAAIDEIQPLIEECFELARQEHPELREARAMVHFSIVGDEQLGGVIEESKIEDGSEHMTPSLSECVRETMYGLKLRAPEGRGRVEVTYPFKLAADGEKANTATAPSASQPAEGSPRAASPSAPARSSQ